MWSLYPVRVLLAAEDPRFLRAAIFLLKREGFDVVGTCEPGEAPGLARELRPHVVVVDGTGSRAAAGRTALAIEAEEPPIPVLLVSAGAERPRGALSRTPECGSFPELTRELRRLYGRTANGSA